MSVNHIGDYNREIRAWLLRVFEHAASLPRHLLVRRPCPLCGSQTSEPFANNGYLDYERCAECSLIFMNPAIPADAVDRGFAGDDKLLMDYFGIVLKYKSAPPERPDARSDNKLRDIHCIKPSGRLLDIGCSVGDFLHKAKFFYDVEGVEVNPYTSAVAARDFKVHTRPLAALKLGADYDVVTLHQILYGVPDPVGLLRDINTVMRRDGILYINTPNADSYAMQLYGGRANHLYGYMTLNVFNRRSLEKLAATTGFELISFRTEWLDIYFTDLIEFLDNPGQFIHKKNGQLPDYADKIRLEEQLQEQLGLDLGHRGNYLVAVLKKRNADAP